MIHQVAIKSLPQDWLFCATWCSENDFANAKVIDLCNNPMTKEAKLTAAQRIVPEWKDYDQEIKNLLNKVELGEVEHEELIEIVKDGTDKKGENLLKLCVRVSLICISLFVSLQKYILNCDD